MMNETQKNEVLKHNYLAAAEMGEEGNYNMIDGIINNVEKPSILDHLRQFKQQSSERGNKPEKEQLPEIEK
jgi:hypothetical protein